MPLYTYKGYDQKTGANKSGRIEAESLKAARQKIRKNEKVIVSDIKEELSADKKAAAGQSSKLFAPKVSLTDLTVMTRQFATLQRAHVPLDESLRALVGQVESRLLGNTLAAIKDSVSEGQSLGDSTAKFPQIFNKLYVNMVKAGESSGTLGVVLERLADFQEYQVKVRGQIFSALAYPAIMILASLGIIAYLFVSVVPKLQKIFKSLKVKLPWYTESLISFSEFIQVYWWLVLIGAGVFYVLFRAWRQSESGKQKFDRWALAIPLFGPILMRISVAGFTRTFSTLLDSGVPIVSALDITKNTISNSVISKVVDDAKTAVQEGDSLASTIDRSGEFPPLVTHMIRTGEKTGDLEGMLNHVAEAYDAEVERKISALISMIEPLMIMVMGGIVAFVVIAMLVPMLSVMSQVR